jgi:hypothetical protein
MTWMWGDAPGWGGRSAFIMLAFWPPNRRRNSAQVIVPLAGGRKRMVGLTDLQGGCPMPLSGFRRRALCGALFLVCLVGSAPAAMAAVYPAGRGLSAEAVQQFLSDPAGLLAAYPNGGAQMIARVKDLAATDPATVNGILGTLKAATPDQASAIGTALGQVAMLAVSTDQAFATDLQTKIAETGNVSAITAFSAVVGGDIKLAAATGPGAGAGGGGESQTGGGNSLGGFGLLNSLNLPTSVKNTPDSFPSPSFSSSSGAGSSVSPSSP